MRLRTLVAGLLTVALATGAAIAVSDGPAGAADYKKSVAGGVINYKEVLARAAYWVSVQPNYNQGGSALDANKTKYYRTDCSGYVDMALHLAGTQDSTGGYAGDSRFTYLYDVSKSRSSMTPNHIDTGDVFVDQWSDPAGQKPSEHHAFLFGEWSSDGTHFTYYTFGKNPVEKKTGAFADSTLAYEATTHYKVYRYKKLDYSDPGIYDGPPHS